MSAGLDALTAGADDVAAVAAGAVARGDAAAGGGAAVTDDAAVGPVASVEGATPGGVEASAVCGVTGSDGRGATIDRATVVPAAVGVAVRRRARATGSTTRAGDEQRPRGG